MNLKLCCNEDGLPIEDIFKHNHNCEYRDMCAGCELLVTEDECTYLEHICSYNINEYDDNIIEGDNYPLDEVNTPGGDIIVETLSTVRAYPCQYGEYGKKCTYKDECPFQEEV